VGDKDSVPVPTANCEPGLGVMETVGNKWVLGNTFLRRYYSIFDDDKGLVGFVRSHHPDEPDVVQQAHMMPFLCVLHQRADQRARKAEQRMFL